VVSLNNKKTCRLCCKNESQYQYNKAALWSDVTKGDLGLAGAWHGVLELLTIDLDEVVEDITAW
jgi:hypothetical protein